MSCHVMSCHVMSCHATSRHVTSCHVMSCHVMSCHVMSFLVLSCQVLSCFFFSVVDLENPPDVTKIRRPRRGRSACVVCLRCSSVALLLAPILLRCLVVLFCLYYYRGPRAVGHKNYPINYPIKLPYKPTL